MNTMNTHPIRTLNRDLAKFIEPLASYICATDRPRDVLASALAVLFDEVGETNRAALSCVRAARSGSGR
jgi:hypothetical protein